MFIILAVLTRRAALTKIHNIIRLDIYNSCIFYLRIRLEQSDRENAYSYNIFPLCSAKDVTF